MKPITDHVHVDLGPRSYDIVIGTDLVSELGYHITPHLDGPKVHVITDETVYNLYGKALHTLERDVDVSILPPGEGSKSFQSLQTVLDNCFSQGLGRKDTIIAFGGGVVGDLAGFAASIYKRGCQFIQIPTTLLSQVDSSVGGKTGINVPQGKNLIGAFYQPRFVLADIDVLKTLPLRELKAGYAEVLKYGLIGDAEFFNWLSEGHGEALLKLSPSPLKTAIARSCRDKAAIVAADECEQGQRALLNLGHSFAHALEAAAGYDGSLLHGEAVSAGLDMAFEFSNRLGLCPKSAVDSVQRHITQMKLVKTADLAPLLQDPDALVATMKQDKKNSGGELTLILAHDIGRAFVMNKVPEAELLSYVYDLKARYAR